MSYPIEMAYIVVLRPAAERERRKLPRDIRFRIKRALLLLENEPRPSGVVKLTGYTHRWRIRVGDYRIVYQVDDESRKITVLYIAHRREVYRQIVAR